MTEQNGRLKRLLQLLIRTLPGWIILCGVLILITPNLEGLIIRVAEIGGFDTVGVPMLAESRIAPLFTSEIDYWEDEIVRWADGAGIDPNLIATIMQIESCGDPRVISPAGAQGLMQVMPQHFAAGEDPLDPDTNAMRGLGVLLNDCLNSPYNTERDVGLAFACYNGGPRVLVNSFGYWPRESRNYYIWGSQIYADAQQGLETSETLGEWLDAGGVNLCRNASEELGLTFEESEVGG